MVHGVLRLQRFVMKLRLNNRLGRYFSCDFSVFGQPNLVSVEVIRSFPTKCEGSFFPGWINEVKQGTLKVFLPVCGGASEVSPENIS